MRRISITAALGGHDYAQQTPATDACLTALPDLRTHRPARGRSMFRRRSMCTLIPVLLMLLIGCTLPSPLGQDERWIDIQGPPGTGTARSSGRW